MAETWDFTWQQGADLPIELLYKSGPTGAAVPVDLSLYKFRMDIVGPDGRVLSVVNDESITDTDPITAGNQGDTTYEATLTSGGNILINLPRAATLPGGVFYKYITANPAVRTFAYDMFLRDTAGLQEKIMAGTITVERSVTYWA